MVSTLVISLPASVPLVSATSSNPTTNTTSSINPRNRSGPTPKRILTKVPWVLGRNWQDWGVRGALIATKQGHYTDYSISVSVSLPLARILGSYALTWSLSVRSTPLCRSAFTFRPPRYFAVARVVESNHPFMSACQNGDIETVRFMLRSGEGRPTDVTPYGSTPMLVSQ